VTEAGEASGGAAGSATGQDPTPVSVPPLLPEDDFPTSSVCPGASAVDHWQFPISPQPRAVLAITPSTSYVFYGQLTSTLPSGASGGFSAWLLRTDDGGDTWCQLDLPEPIRELVVSPMLRSVLYAASTTHYYRSPDYGLSWQRQAAVGSGRLVAHETEIDVVYEVGASARRSMDGGASWESAGGNKPVHEIAFAEDGQEILYGVSAPCKLHRSSDWGRTWREFRIADGCLEEKFGPSRPLTVASGIVYLTEWVDGKTLVHYSTDNGEHWERTDLLPFEKGQPLFFRGDAAGVLYLRDGGTLQRSTDYGQSWSEHLTVPDGGHVATLGPRPGVFHARESRDLSLLSLDDGESWTTTAVAREGTVHTTKASPEHVYIAGAHWLYRSTDGGQTFESLAWPNDVASSRQLVVAAYDPRQLAASDGTRWMLSMSGGTAWSSWAPIINGVEGPALFQSVTFDPSTHGVWYATWPGGAHVLQSHTAGGWFNDSTMSDPAREVVPAFDGRVVYSLAGELSAPIVERSDNGGSIWMTPCRPPEVCPTSLQVHPTSPLVVAGAGTETISGVVQSVLMSSKDGGGTWLRQPVGTAAGVTWRTFFGSDQSLIAWSSLDHAYRSDDLGVTWARFSVPVAGEVARDYSSPAGVFTNNGGIWRYEP
jgi:photosystem II stability/assembly factor-like uncharacterized protein